MMTMTRRGRKQHVIPEAEAQALLASVAECEALERQWDEAQERRKEAVAVAVEGGHNLSSIARVLNINYQRVHQMVQELVESGRLAVFAEPERTQPVVDDATDERETGDND